MHASLTVPAGQLIDTLKNMKITVFDKYYTGAFTRTDVTDALHELTGMRFEISKLPIHKDIGLITVKLENVNQMHAF